MDNTWSVRVPDELKEKLQKLLEESGISSKEFFANAIQSLELELVGNTKKEFQVDIDELHILMSRINSIYINIFERGVSIEKAKELEFENKILEKTEMFIVINNKIKELEKNAEYMRIENTELKQINDEFKNRNSQITEMAETSKVLISELKEKNETLTSLLVEYKGYKNIVDEVRKATDSEKELRINSEMKLKDSKYEIDALKLKFDELKQLHNQELFRVQELLTIEKEKELLKVRQEFQSKVEITQQEYSTKVKELLKNIQDMQLNMAMLHTKREKKDNGKENFVKKLGIE